MALTNTQKKDATYLASLLENTKQQREKALRDATVNTQQALRRVKQYNALNGFQGGPEESSYLLVNSKGNADIAAINAQFNPLIAEYQAYIDALRSRGSGGGVVARRQATSAPVGLVDYQNLGGTQAARDAARAGTIAGMRRSGYTDDQILGTLSEANLLTASGKTPGTSVPVGGYRYKI